MLKMIIEFFNWIVDRIKGISPSFRVPPNSEGVNPSYSNGTADGVNPSFKPADGIGPSYDEQANNNIDNGIATPTTRDKGSN